MRNGRHQVVVTPSYSRTSTTLTSNCLNSTMPHLHAWLDGSEQTDEMSVAGTAVDRLAEKVHVAEVAGVLLDEVGEDPP